MNQQINQPVRRSRRLATIIPASHWISIGYSQNDAQLMEKLQNDMKKCCDGDKIDLRGSPGVILPHDDMLIPHWKKLAKATGARATDFRILNITMPESVLDIMLPSLRSNNVLTRISLCNSNMGNEGLLRLADFLGINTSLKSLCFGYETINDLFVASSLSDAIKDHPSLTGVGFIGCGLSNIEILEKILEGCTTLIRFAITGERLLGGSKALAVIEDFIRSNHPTLELLSLDHNRISDDDALRLALALKCNTTLKRFSLMKTDITEVGEKALLKAMYDPSNMDSIVESNHTCRAYTYDIEKRLRLVQRPPIETEVLNINKKNTSRTIQQKIRMKVVLALCGVDGGLFDLSHFNDLPLGVMPRVLELIQGHSLSRTKACRSLLGPQYEWLENRRLEKDALSRLFHTLRGWELPLLFNNLRTQVPTRKRKRRKTCRYH